MPLPQLTFTRFIAALIVLIFHGARSTYPFTVYPGRYFIEYGHIAVVYFFVLSGFILTITYRSSLERTGALNRGQFWLARFSRIYPLYCFALLMTMFVQTTYYNVSVTPAQLIASLSLMQAWLPSLVTTLNGPGWSLSVEAFFYALFPLLLPLLMNLPNRVLAGLLVICWLSGIGLYHLLDSQPKPVNFSSDEYHNLIYYSPWMHLATFVNGCLSGLLFWRYVRQHKPSPARNRLAWCLLVLGLIGLIVIVPQDRLMMYAQGGMLAPVFILFITGLGLQTDTVLTRLFSWLPLVYLGEISYGLYILQMPVIWLFKKVDPLSLGDTFQRDIFTFAALFLVTIICYHLIERPAQTYIRTRWHPRLAHSNS
ncbi:acyltransferase family protein [Spirosoma validum]|uniref:Acyltransferase n=1 Tax=Spirosoma validum TaxID=2771355 RepID=A0A927GEZ4_9BACT|nr:acyltransferase [Spirosoma validum]MBD2755332.1 acyltransferase [Spirosoma validum]